MSAKEELSRWLDAHEREYVEDVKRLVAIRSVRGEAKPGMPYGEGPAAALAEAKKLCEAYGFAVKDYAGHALSADMNSLTPGLDILAHLDVVGEGDGWDTPPYEPTEKDGLLFGRGTSDDKGPAVAALYAMRAFKELGIPLKKNVRLILGTDEESGSEDMAYYYSVEKPAPGTFSPDAAFPVCNVEQGRYAPVFEQSWEEETVLPRVKSFDGGFRINVIPADAEAVIAGLHVDDELRALCDDCCGRMGVRYVLTQEGEDLRVKVTGFGAHASTPEAGNNGITALLTLIFHFPLADCASTRALKALTLFFPHGDGFGEALGIDMYDDVSDDLSLAFTILKMDGKGIHGEFDSRVPVCANDENCRLVAEKKLGEAGFTVTGKMKAPHYVPEDSAFVQALLKAYEDVTGEEGECFAMGGGTYVHDVEGGVAFGCVFPGREPNMHGANECADVEDLILSGKMFARAIAEICR